MSNTGYKGISASFDENGNLWRYQVTVQWKGEIRKWSGRGATLEEALNVREQFEDELDKPRSEKHIRSTQTGVYVSEDGHGNRYWVAQVDQERRHFSIHKHGEAKAFELAKEARLEMGALW
jgi:hypothetical protein